MLLLSPLVRPYVFFLAGGWHSCARSRASGQNSSSVVVLLLVCCLHLHLKRLTSWLSFRVDSLWLVDDVHQSPSLCRKVQLAFLMTAAKTLKSSVLPWRWWKQVHELCSTKVGLRGSFFRSRALTTDVHTVFGCTLVRSYLTASLFRKALDHFWSRIKHHFLSNLAKAYCTR